MPLPDLNKSSQGANPVEFFISGPTGKIIVPHALVLQVNPSELSPSFTRRVERTQTRGGWVEQDFGEELDQVTATFRSGAFINVKEGLAKKNPWDTFAFDKILDLYELYRNNGLIYDDRGKPIFRGSVIMSFDVAIYIGYFTDLEMTWDAENPFSLNGSFSFKSERILWMLSTLPSQGLVTRDRTQAPIVQAPPQVTPQRASESELTSEQRREAVRLARVREQGVVVATQKLFEAQRLAEVRAAGPEAATQALLAAAEGN